MWTQRDILSLMVVGAMIGTALPAQADPVAAARRAHSRAVKLVADGDRAGAIRTYEKALIFAPAFPLALNELGVLLAAEERVDEAIARLEEAVNWSPDFVAAWSNLGAVARQNEDEDLCIDAYGQVLRIAPEDSGGWHGLAYCLLADEELSQALGALERFLELAPADSPLRADAAAAAEALREQGIEPSPPELPSAAPFGPKPPPDPSELPLPPFEPHAGDAAYANHRFMEALAAYEKEAAEKPDNPVLRYKIGAVHAVMGDYLNARRWWGKSVTLDAGRQMFMRHAGLAALTRSRGESEAIPESTPEPTVTDEPAESAEVTDGDEEIAANSPAQPTPAAAGPSVTAAASTDEVDPFDEIREALLAELPSHAWVLLQGKEGAEASYLLGEAALALGRYAEAQDAFTNATLESAPGDMAPWGGLAQALLMQGHQDAAQGAIRDWLKGRDANTREFLLMRERARRTRIRMGPPAAAPSDDG